MKDLSIDLETLGTAPGATILSIGAARFNRDTGEVAEPFYCVINIEKECALSVDPATLKWWLLQSESARLTIAGKDLGARYRSLDAALFELTTLVQSGVERVWGNGATFDISFLENAYRQKSMLIPWHYRAPRDMRTIVDAAEGLGFDPKALPFEGTAHRADHDAVHQAKVIAASWRWIQGKRPATWSVVNTDNYGGDYPNERFEVQGLPSEALARQVAATLQALRGPTASRYSKVVQEPYTLQPGFEP